MLFNSYVFIFLFLPITLAGFFILGSNLNKRAAIFWLVLCSLCFYGWWNPKYIILIIASILFNYGLGVVLNKNRSRGLLALGVAVNLGLLGYFKYTNFLIDNLNVLVDPDVNVPDIVLPLAISFFTFQQITYLVDIYKGRMREYEFVHYMLFVTFFPQLIAGPIVHHSEMLPQFRNLPAKLFNTSNLSIGFIVFSIGLFKKVIIADGCASYVSPVFDNAEAAVAIGFTEAWLAIFAYSFQIYFDFSGYSDMAVGLGYMFGIRLPLNFYSPYKATNIIDFWRSWHITLSRFLRDYLYIPLGGSRKGKTRRYANLMITMLLGGLWHGASWNFLIWGGLHGSYLIINHAWIKLKTSLNFAPENVPGPYARILSTMITFMAVTVAWVFFRAETLAGAANMLQAMTSVGQGQPAPDGGVTLATVAWFGAIGVVVWLFPNTHQFMRDQAPGLIAGLKTRVYALPAIRWQEGVGWSMLVSLLFLASVIDFGGGRVSEFLYYQF